jgi:glycosyltransferase involved in cell wall biosynthesis
MAVDTQEQGSCLGGGVTRPSAVCDVELAFVGTVIPDLPSFWNEACNRAGNMFQERMLAALDEAGLPASLIVSQRPVRLFPRSRVLYVRASRHELESGLSVRMVPFVNLPILRPLTVGAMVVVELMRWRGASRSSRRVVLTYNLTEPSGLFTLIVARLLKATALACVNDIFVPGETVADSWSRRIDFWMQRRLIKRFDGLSVPNRQISREFAPKLPWVRNEGGISNAVVRRFAHPAPPHEIGRDQPFTIVYAGSLTDVNGVPELVAGFTRLAGSGYRLIVAGRGPEEGPIVRAAAQDARIEFRGYLSEAEVLALYAEADLLLNLRITKRIRTDYFFPSKLIEFLATGVPVLSTATGHVREEFGEVLFLLEDETPEALAARISDLAAMDAGRRWAVAAAAREQVLGSHRWSVLGQKLATFIRQLAARE